MYFISHEEEEEEVEEEERAKEEVKEEAKEAEDVHGLCVITHEWELILLVLVWRPFADGDMWRRRQPESRAAADPGEWKWVWFDGKIMGMNHIWCVCVSVCVCVCMYV